MERWRQIDALLAKAYGPDRANWIAGAYRQAEALAELWERIEAQQPAPKQEKPTDET